MLVGVIVALMVGRGIVRDEPMELTTSAALLLTTFMGELHESPLEGWEQRRGGAGKPPLEYAHGQPHSRAVQRGCPVEVAPDELRPCLPQVPPGTN
ncbi:MAG TPA: hypothetical protein VFC51_17255 [Chloroflexota bacterium]|nr:hypothetical protein [Chloroflexota bacterium]